MIRGDVDLVGKVVKLHQHFFKKGLKAEDNLFKCCGGFGAEPNKLGTKVFGYFLSDGEEACVRRSDVAEIVEVEDESAGTDSAIE